MKHQGKHGRTNNRAGNFFNFFLIFLNVLLYFLAGIIIEPGFFSILFLKQRRHSRQNVHSDDSILDRFRPSHACSHHHSMGGKGPQVHQFVGLYSDPQCNAGTLTAVVTSYYVFFRLNLPLNKFRRDCYTFRRQCYKFCRQCYDGVGNMSGQRTCVAKRIQELEPGLSNHILKVIR